MLKDKHELDKAMKLADKLGYKEYSKKMLEPPENIKIKNLKKHKYYDPKPEDIEHDLWEENNRWSLNKTKKL
jgi:hypothetical protein